MSLHSVAAARGPVWRAKEASVSDEQQSDAVPDPQGHFVKIPYDWRRPTVARFRARWWNPDDPRFFTPRSFGWGFDFNLYWLAHPLGYVAARSRARVGADSSVPAEAHASTGAEDSD
jgi:hypothetical protein